MTQTIPTPSKPATEASVVDTDLRHLIRQKYLADETQTLQALMSRSGFSAQQRKNASDRAADLVRRVRKERRPSLMENFLAEYGLSTKEGVALMCLAEALLRVPDSTTIDDLIEDKVAYGAWREHLGHSASALVNSSTWALMLTGRLIAPTDDGGMSAILRNLVKRMGEPVVRVAVGRAMRELGRQFVLGRTIKEATERAAGMEARGYTYSYDMLGEAARTDADALEYLEDYSNAISSLSGLCKAERIADNPGISVKLSALHPRYEIAQKSRMLDVLVSRTRRLARAAAAANMGFNIDAEEADRLDLSLDVIEAVLSDPELEGWDGFGVVVQAFGKRTSEVIDWLYQLSEKLNRKIMVRLVKGAYWDSEIKRAQTLGLETFPVYTRKIHSDISFLCCAEKLLGMTDRIYPQFATHNAHSIAAVLTMAEGVDNSLFEFQRLHGMGEALHDMVLTTAETRCRIYAPVGNHKDLLAYLVRRLLENGANSSFVNQIVDKRISPEEIAADPFTQVQEKGIRPSPKITPPPHIYGEGRRNAKGFDITDPLTLKKLQASLNSFGDQQWRAEPMIGGDWTGGVTEEVINPARPEDTVGRVTSASVADIERAITQAQNGFYRWSKVASEDRAVALEKVADLYEEHATELFAIAMREAGKSLADAVGEVREAVDFCRFYAQQLRLVEQEHDDLKPRGVITCISPWNFPLAIFTGQILAAVAAGNAVLAKPADQTPLIAARAVELMHQAGIPTDVVQLLPGSGKEVGAPLTRDARIGGICFTGSTATATTINRTMADNLPPDAPLIAETGGLNAMIVDSTALPEQVVRDVIASAFQSAGQRCSALRCLYVQEDIAENLLSMLYGAMDALKIGDPWHIETDVGPVIDEAAASKIRRYCEGYAAKGKILKTLETPKTGRYVSPTVIKVSGINEMEEEIFGPVLHVATFHADDIDKVVDDINGRGYGLTFGLHTRMDTRIEHVSSRIHVGNTYVNRNQIGAIVGSQPFGGEGLSGTGPKAGGPAYLKRFMTTETSPTVQVAKASGKPVDAGKLGKAIARASKNSAASSVAAAQNVDAAHKLYEALSKTPPALPTPVRDMPGPTGETNRLSEHPRGLILCTGPDADLALEQAALALLTGNRVVAVAPGLPEQIQKLKKEKNLELPLEALDGSVAAEVLTQTAGFDAVCSTGPAELQRSFRKALAAREGVLIPLISETRDPERFVIERHLCIDTTAAGGNASLIAASE